MSQEIIYTSAPKGLKPGSSGYCTVISSEGMAPNLASRLESHGGYTHVFGVSDPRRSQNPVNWSYTKMSVAGTTYHVVSRVGDAGLDHSGRSNKLAHHIALDASELSPAGPARTLKAPGVMCAEWTGEVGLQPRRKLPAVSIPSSYQEPTWRNVTHDTGWAGVVAERLLASTTDPLSVIFGLGTDTIALVTEVLDLIPPGKPRWEISFSTYFTKLSPGTDCRLRFVLDGTSEATALRKNPHAAVIDLMGTLAPAKGGKLYQCAKNGELPVDDLPAAPRELSTPGRGRPGANRRLNAADPVEVLEDVEDEYADMPGSTRGSRGKHSKSKQSALQSRLIWICGGVAGLVLLACLITLMLPGPQIANPQLAAGGNASDSPNLGRRRSDQGREPSKVTDEGKGGTTIPEVDATTLKPEVIASKSPVTEAPGGDKPPVTPAEKPEPKPVEDPFAKLPADEIDPKMAILDLFDSPTQDWNIRLDDPESLKMELLGSSIFQSETIAKYELEPSPVDVQHRVWTLAFKSKSPLFESQTLGEFRLETLKDDHRLSFSWSDRAKFKPEAEIVKFLTIGLSTGKNHRLCRLGVAASTVPFSLAKDGNKENATEVSIDLDQILADVLKNQESQLFIIVELVGDIAGFKSDNKQLSLRIHPNQKHQVSLSVNPDMKRDSNWNAFKDDPELALLEFKPTVEGKSFRIHVEAFATVAIFDKYKVVLNVFPKPVKVRLPLSSTILGRRLNRNIASEVTQNIDNAISYLEKEIPILAENINATKTPGPMIEKAKENLVYLKESLSELALYKSRHSASSLKWLWESLTGIPGEGNEGSSILGAIHRAKLGVQIAYECKFKGKDYSIVVFDASKK